MREYFKIQYFDTISMSWKDIQKTYPTIKDAIKEVKRSKTWRIMHIEENKRHIITAASLQA